LEDNSWRIRSVAIIRINNESYLKTIMMKSRNLKDKWLLGHLKKLINIKLMTLNPIVIQSLGSLKVTYDVKIASVSLVMPAGQAILPGWMKEKSYSKEIVNIKIINKYSKLIVEKEYHSNGASKRLCTNEVEKLLYNCISSIDHATRVEKLLNYRSIGLNEIGYKIVEHLPKKVKDKFTKKPHQDILSECKLRYKLNYVKELNNCIVAKSLFSRIY